jgi:hypothetical protein
MSSHNHVDFNDEEPANLHTHDDGTPVKKDPFEPVDGPAKVVTLPESMYDRMVAELHALRAEKAARAVGQDAIPRLDDIHAAFGSPVEHGAFWETNESKEHQVPWSVVQDILQRSGGFDAELAHRREILRMKLDCLCRLTGDAEAPETRGHYSDPADGARIGGIFSRSPW